MGLNLFFIKVSDRPNWGPACRLMPCHGSAVDMHSAADTCTLRSALSPFFPLYINRGKLSKLPEFLFLEFRPEIWAQDPSEP